MAPAHPQSGSRRNTGGELNVAIAGGGIGGLAAALAISAIGAEVTVYEKRSDRLEEGAGIQLGPNGTRILRSLGVLERLMETAAAPMQLIVNDAPSGRRLARLPLGTWMENRHGAPYLTAQRADLHTALEEAVAAAPRVALHRGTSVADVEHRDETVVPVSDNGRELGRFDLLIAADGLRSRLRRNTAPASPLLSFTGKSAARAVVPVSELPDGPQTARDSVGIWLSPRGHLVHYPVNAGRHLALVVIRNGVDADESWATRVDRKWVEEAVSDFARPARDIVTAADTFRKWSLFGMPPLESFVSSRVALLGDAAHPVLPFFAQGAVLALEDAATLTDCLRRHENVAPALADYDLARRPRAEAVQQASRNNGRIYHLAGAMRHARNMTLKFAPPERMMARYDWLYGWRVG